MTNLIASIINAFRRKRHLLKDGGSWDDTRTRVHSFIAESTPPERMLRNPSQFRVTDVV